MYNDWKRIGLNVDDDELEAMIKAKAKEAEAKVRTKGATRQQLDGREEMALRMLGANLSLRTQTEIWAEAGILTTAPSLRAYFKRYYPDEWAAYLSRTARGQLKNRLQSEPTGEEKAEINAFLGKPALQVGANQEAGSGKQKEEEAPAATDQVGRGKQSEETPATATEIKPAATGDKSTTRIDPTAIGMSSEERKALADDEARRIENLYNPPKK